MDFKINDEQRTFVETVRKVCQSDYRAAIVPVIRLGGDTDTMAAMPLNPLKLLARNLVFMLIVLAQGFRRLLPPY